VSDLFADIVGQERAVGALRAAVRAPVHAYLLEGPAGSGKRQAALAFGAALLCPAGGCGACDTCLRARSEVHPDLVVVEREGPAISVGQAREIRRLALRSPNEGRRKVLVLVDFHLAQDAGPALLKVVEEPPSSTVFVILAEHVPPELETIASRCVRVPFDAVPPALVAQVLSATGVEGEIAEVVAQASGGRLDRARLLAADPGFGARLEAWRAVPGRLDGTGERVSVVVSELMAMLVGAAAPLEERHEAERAELEDRVKRSGARGSGRKELGDRQKRELRRLRADELRFGLATLAATYRDALLSGVAPTQSCLQAVDALTSAAAALVRNPNETLLLQALLLNLPPLAAAHSRA
jgi:DNA polymerase-3 subunit delta'